MAKRLVPSQLERVASFNESESRLTSPWFRRTVSRFEFIVLEHWQASGTRQVAVCFSMTDSNELARSVNQFQR